MQKRSETTMIKPLKKCVCRYLRQSGNTRNSHHQPIWDTLWISYYKQKRNHCPHKVYFKPRNEWCNTNVYPVAIENWGRGAYISHRRRGPPYKSPEKDSSNKFVRAVSKYILVSRGGLKLFGWLRVPLRNIWSLHCFALSVWQLRWPAVVINVSRTE